MSRDYKGIDIRLAFKRFKSLPATYSPQLFYLYSIAVHM